MKIILFWAFAGALLLLEAPRARGYAAADFDSYTFALSWEPAFCEGKSSIPECRGQRPDRFDATNLTLHGLWPDKSGDSGHDYGYCGIDSATRAIDRAPTWCQLPQPPLSAATRNALETAMPGVVSCLDHHEWVKHGSCSGLAADDYFAAAASLDRQLAATTFGRFLSSNAGRTVTADDALSAFERDFGPGSRSMIALNCAMVRGVPALMEARLRVSKVLRPDSDLKSVLIASGGRGSCPSSFLLDAVPAGLTQSADAR